MTSIFFHIRTNRVVTSAIVFANRVYASTFVKTSSSSHPMLKTHVIDWPTKFISTIFLFDRDSPFCESALRDTISPLVALSVVQRLNQSSLGLKFLEYCQRLFNIKHCLETYEFLLRLLCERGKYGSIETVVISMSRDSLFPNHFLVSYLVESCARAGELDLAVRLISNAKVQVSTYAYNLLLDAFVQSNRVSEAKSFLMSNIPHLQHPDACSLNILLRGFCKSGKPEEGFQFLDSLTHLGCVPDKFTYNILIDGFSKANQMGMAYSTFNLLVEKGYAPDVCSYTSIISGFCKMGRIENAYSLYGDMCKRNVKPNLFTFNALINGSGKSGDCSSMENLFKQLEKMKFTPDVITFTSLIDGYHRNGGIEKCLNAWNTMKDRKVAPNLYTYSILMKALCAGNKVEEAREIVRKIGARIHRRACVYNPIIDAYCKSGNIDEANAVTAEMEEANCKGDKVTYTILIIGHCMKGRMIEAISIFEKMFKLGCSPDAVTINLLSSFLFKAGMPVEAKLVQSACSGTKKNIEVDLAV